MLWYIAFIAGLNLALGYLWGAYLRSCPRCAKIRELGAVIAGAAMTPASGSEPAQVFDSRVEEAGADTSPAVEANLQVEVVADEGAAPIKSAPQHKQAEAATVDELPPLAPETAEIVPRDPATGLATREHVEQLLEKLASRMSAKDPTTVALVEVDEIDWTGGSSNEVIDERVLCGVSIIARESLASSHTAARYSEQQLLLVLSHEDVHQATRRAEELRQRVATTEFIADGRAVNTSVTCALAQVAHERSGRQLLEFLHEALGEAKRYGGNRTFMHDGHAPSPVVPPELELAPQQLAI